MFILYFIYFYSASLFNVFSLSFLLISSDSNGWFYQQY